MSEKRFERANLAACVIPWKENFDFDGEIFKKHVNDLMAKGYSHLYLFGTAGEGYAMEENRFVEVVDAFAELTLNRPELTPQIGAISLSMEQIIRRIGIAHDKGFRLFQISLPSWGALTKEETLIFFKTVCSQYPDSRFLHYNLPRTKRIIDGEEYHAIASEVENLVATKNSTTDYYRTMDLVLKAPELQHFLLETNYAMGCTVGECSLLCSYGGLFPETTRRFFEAGVEGNVTECFKHSRFFYEFGSGLFAKCSGGKIDGSFDKSITRLGQRDFPVRLLPPYQGLSEDEFLSCRNFYESGYRDIN